MNSNWLNRINPKIYNSNLFDFKVYTFSTFAPFAFANKKNFKSVYNIAQFFFRTARFDVSLSSGPNVYIASLLTIAKNMKIAFVTSKWKKPNTSEMEMSRNADRKK